LKKKGSRVALWNITGNGIELSGEGHRVPELRAENGSMSQASAFLVMC
jgi:hypothetical protein